MRRPRHPRRLGAPPGCSPVQTGLVAAIPQLAQVAQVPAAWASALAGRRRVALATIALSRQAFLPLAALLLLAPSPAAARALLVAAAAICAAMGMAGNVAWTAWMGDLVPARIRGRYFARRTAVCVLGGTVASLATARFPRRDARPAGAARALAPRARGVPRRRRDRRAPRSPARAAARSRAAAERPVRPPSAARSARPRDPDVPARLERVGRPRRRVLHLPPAREPPRELRRGGAPRGRRSALQAVSAPFFGRAIDRVGARPVLAAASFVRRRYRSCGSRRLRTCSGRSRSTPRSAGSPGARTGSPRSPCRSRWRRGASARSTWRPSRARRGSRSRSGTAAGGALLAALPATGPFGEAHALRIVFVLSAAGRLSAAFLALRIAEPGAGTLAELRAMARTALAPLKRAA